MNMVVRQLPPSESCRMRVILLSRYGTWDFCRDKEMVETKGSEKGLNKERGELGNGGENSYCTHVHMLFF